MAERHCRNLILEYLLTKRARRVVDRERTNFGEVDFHGAVHDVDFCVLPPRPSVNSLA